MKNNAQSVISIRKINKIAKSKLTNVNYIKKTRDWLYAKSLVFFARDTVDNYPDWLKRVKFTRKSLSYTLFVDKLCTYCTQFVDKWA